MTNFEKALSLQLKLYNYLKLRELKLMAHSDFPLTPDLRDAEKVVNEAIMRTNILIEEDADE